MTHNFTSKATLSSKGQIVIPKEIRCAMGLHAGSQVLFSIKENGILEVRPLGRSIDMFFGKLKAASQKPLSIAEIDQAIIESVMENEPQHKG